MLRRVAVARMCGSCAGAAPLAGSNGQGGSTNESEVVDTWVGMLGAVVEVSGLVGGENLLVLLLLLLRILHMLMDEALHVLTPVGRGCAPTLPLPLRREILALPSPRRLRPLGDPARRVGRCVAVAGPVSAATRWDVAHVAVALRAVGCMVAGVEAVGDAVVAGVRRSTQRVEALRARHLYFVVRVTHGCRRAWTGRLRRGAEVSGTERKSQPANPAAGQRVAASR